MSGTSASQLLFSVHCDQWQRLKTIILHDIVNHKPSILNQNIYFLFTHLFLAARSVKQMYHSYSFLKPRVTQQNLTHLSYIAELMSFFCCTAHLLTTYFRYSTERDSFLCSRVRLAAAKNCSVRLGVYCTVCCMN